MTRTRAVTIVLASLLFFDIALSITAFFFPQFWFDVFHGVAYDDPQGFLRRCGANWTAFALFQGIALWRWKREPAWLLVVAGVRLSDIFTDWAYVAFATDHTWFAWPALIAMGFGNIALGVFFFRSYFRLPAVADAKVGNDGES